MTRRTRLRWALALVAASFVAVAPVAGVSASTPPASSDTGGTNSSKGAPSSKGTDPVNVPITESWTLAPASSATESGNRPNLSYTIEPGKAVKDAVTVYNLGNVPLIFNVYATDAFNSNDGTLSLLPGDKKPTDVGTWLKLDQKLVSVPPGKQSTIRFVLKVPRDATPGDHVGAVLAASPTRGTGQRGEAITLDRRTGTRLYVRVAGDLRPELAITNMESDYHQSVNSFDGKATVKFRVENRGNVRMTGNPIVETGGPLGALSKTVKMPPISELLPGEHADLSVQVTGVPAMMANTTKVSIRPESVGVKAPPTSSASSTQFAPPITLLLLLLVAVLVLLALRQRRRRKNQAPASRQLPPAAERELQHQ
jgi:MYXO-CTERM domain-containing protein